jgi:hypothetical protein
MIGRSQLRDYMVRVELTVWGQLEYRDLAIRATSKKDAAHLARAAGYRPVIAVWRADEDVLLAVLGEPAR